MIKIYTSNRFFEDREIIIDNESFFNNNIRPKQLSKTSLEVMWRIDKAKLIDTRTGKIETPYGICSIRDLSTGCKTVLNCIYIIEHKDKYPNAKAIELTECGWNAIEEVFQYFEDNKIEHIGLVIEHDNFLFKCKDRDYLVDNKRHIKSMYEF